MKITITGSLGHISKPLTKELVQKGHTVTVISSKAEKQQEIEALGAIAAIGSVEDSDFVVSAFEGADLVYCMIPPNYTTDLIDYCRRLANNYANAVIKGGIKRVIHLSSIGAHMEKDSGLILGHYTVESIFKKLPQDVSVTYMRPTAFYYNLYAFLPRIKKEGVIASNYGEDDRIPWVSPIDIATAVIEEIEADYKGTKIRYVASDEPTCNEIAKALGAAIGIPDLKWITIGNEQMRQALEAAGVPSGRVTGLVEMNASMHNGALLEDYFRNRPAVMGKVKIDDFAKEFAEGYNK